MESDNQLGHMVIDIKGSPRATVFRKQFENVGDGATIEFEEAEAILDSKNYVGGGDMRGRQSFNPLEKMGLAFLDNKNKIRISDFGNYFLKDEYDLGEVFFRSFLKWQLPNPDTNEVNAFSYVDPYWLLDDIQKHPERYTAWFNLIVARVIAYHNEKHTDDTLFEQKSHSV